MSQSGIVKLLPLLLLFSSNVLSEDTKFQDWIFRQELLYKSSFTKSHSGNELGMVCKSGKCFFYFSPVEKCPQQKIIGYLMSPEANSLRVKIKCFKHEVVNFYNFENIKEVREFLINNSVVYFMSDDGVNLSNISVFSSNGSEESLNLLMNSSIAIK